MKVVEEGEEKKKKKEEEILFVGETKLLTVETTRMIENDRYVISFSLSLSLSLEIWRDFQISRNARVVLQFSILHVSAIKISRSEKFINADKCDKHVLRRHSFSYFGTRQDTR